MATERQIEGTQQPAAWSPAYEQSAWLDVHNKEIQVEGDPVTHRNEASYAQQA